MLHIIPADFCFLLSGQILSKKNKQCWLSAVYTILILTINKYPFLKGHHCSNCKVIKVKWFWLPPTPAFRYKRYFKINGGIFIQNMDDCCHFEWKIRKHWWGFQTQFFQLFVNEIIWSDEKTKICQHVWQILSVVCRTSPKLF